MSISIRRNCARMASSSSASVTASGSASLRSSNVMYPCSFASLVKSRMRACKSSGAIPPGLIWSPFRPGLTRVGAVVLFILCWRARLGAAFFFADLGNGEPPPSGREIA